MSKKTKKEKATLKDEIGNLPFKIHQGLQESTSDYLIKNVKFGDKFTENNILECNVAFKHRDHEDSEFKLTVEITREYWVAGIKKRDTDPVSWRALIIKDFLKRFNETIEKLFKDDDDNLKEG